MLSLLAKLGHDPKRSLSIFLRGLGLFSLGMAFIALGYFYHHIWQILGLFFLALGAAVAAWGYLGIFSHRWFTILNKRKVNGNNHQ